MAIEDKPRPGAHADELLRALEVLGQDLGLDGRREYPVRGGRIDLVWLWRDAPSALGLESDGLPLVGFEIESSWRTRKHIKGDFINLFDLGAALGVIVLLGKGKDVDATARFANILVDRPGPRIVVWTESDARRILRTGPAGDDTIAARPGGISSMLSEARAGHSGKYRLLYEWLASQRATHVETSFKEIEELLGMRLPPSARQHAAHWSGYEGSAVARAIRDAGWRSRHVDLRRERVTFVRTASADGGSR